MVRALHEAPDDIATYLDPSTGDDKQHEGLNDEKFRALREGLVWKLADSSVRCTCDMPSCAPIRRVVLAVISERCALFFPGNPRNVLWYSHYVVVRHLMGESFLLVMHFIASNTLSSRNVWVI